MPIRLHGNPCCSCSTCAMARAESERRGVAFDEHYRSYAPGPFLAGAVPTGPAWNTGSSGFVEGLVNIHPEFRDDAERMKWSSPGYVYCATIYFRANLMPGWIGAGIISAKTGDGALRCEHIFGSTGGEPPRPFYTPAPGTSLGPLAGHTNDLAVMALKTGELGAFQAGAHVRIRSHWPTLEDFSEPELRELIAQKQAAAKLLPARP